MHNKNKYLALTFIVGTLWLQQPLLAQTVELPASSKITQLSEHSFYGGQPTSEELAILAATGVLHVINLRPLSEQFPYSEAADVTRQGMAYYSIPISGPADFSIDAVKLFDQILGRIGEEPRFLHCSSGNRVGSLMALRAAWLGGASNDEAISVGRRWGLTRLEAAVRKALQESALE